MCKITHEVAITWVAGDESFQKRLRGHPARAVQRPAVGHPSAGAGGSAFRLKLLLKRLIYSVTSARVTSAHWDQPVSH